MAKAVAKAERGSLSAERIELAALEVIEAEGLGGFSIRKLAATLGCEAMSIYHYFPSKGHLMDALVDRVIAGDLRVLEPSAENWRARIEAAAREWRAMAKRRPAFFGYLATHRLNTPAGLSWLNGILGLFRSLGIGEDTGPRMFRTLGYYLTGAGIDETAGYARGASTVTPVPDDTMAASYPHVVAASRWFRESEWEATFELGLRVMLDSIQRMIDRRLL